MKFEELKGFAIEELGEKLTSLKRTLMELRFQSKTGKLETKNSLKTTRRDVARIMTLINQQKNAPQAVVKKSEAVKKAKPAKVAVVKKAAVKKPVVKKLSAKTSKK